MFSGLTTVDYLILGTVAFLNVMFYIYLNLQGYKAGYNAGFDDCYNNKGKTKLEILEEKKKNILK